MFDKIPRNVRLHSPECLATFPRIFGNIPRNVWQHSPEYLRTFPGTFGYIPGMFGNIPRNVWQHSPECLRTFSGMFGYIPRNFWRYSSEYNIPPISRVPFPVPVFLVLCIALCYMLISLAF